VDDPRTWCQLPGAESNEGNGDANSCGRSRYLKACIPVSRGRWGRACRNSKAVASFRTAVIFWAAPSLSCRDWSLRNVSLLGARARSVGPWHKAHAPTYVKAHARKQERCRGRRSDLRGCHAADNAICANQGYRTADRTGDASRQIGPGTSTHNDGQFAAGTHGRIWHHCSTSCFLMPRERHCRL